MSVDTYLQRKNLKGYVRDKQLGIELYVARTLADWSQSFTVSLKRFVVWKSFDVEVVPIRPHVHGAT